MGVPGTSPYSSVLNHAYHPYRQLLWEDAGWKNSLPVRTHTYHVHRLLRWQQTTTLLLCCRRGHWHATLRLC